MGHNGTVVISLRRRRRHHDLQLRCFSQLTEEMAKIEEMLSNSLGGDELLNIQREEVFITENVKPLFSKLLQAKLLHESEVLCDIVKISGCKLVGAYALSICETSNIENTRIAKSLVSLALSCTQAPNDLAVAQHMLLELVKPTAILFGVHMPRPLSR